MFHLRKLLAIITQLALVAAFTFSTASTKTNGRDAITQEDLKEWLTYLASDELGGRNTYTEGLGLAAAYIAERLRSWASSRAVQADPISRELGCSASKAKTTRLLQSKRVARHAPSKIEKESAFLPTSVANKRSHQTRSSSWATA
jgi:hypothetical protein